MYKSFAPYNFLLLKFTYIGTVLYVVKLISKILCWFRCAICDKKLLYSYLVIGYHASKEHQLKLAEYKERYMSQQQQKKEEKKTESKGGEDEVEIIEVVNKEGVKKPPVEKGVGSIRAEDPWEASLVRCHPCGVVIPAPSLRNHFRVKHPHLPGYKGMITFLKKTYCRYSGRQRIQ